jgi:hypothetical protein
MSRTEWILGGILALLIVAVVAVAIFSLARPAAQVAEPAAVTARPRQSAQAAYAVAEPVARAWAADAGLVSANTAWRPGSNWRSGESDWTFTFYSAGESATVLISVASEEARLITVRESSRDRQTIDVAQWQVDSPDFMERLLTTDGHELLNPPAADSTSLILRLRVDDYFAWEGIINNEATSQLYTLRLDAGTGQMLEVNQIP